jgi:hypothetical protein
MDPAIQKLGSMFSPTILEPLYSYCCPPSRCAVVLALRVRRTQREKRYKEETTKRNRRSSTSSNGGGGRSRVGS